jgi:transcriptional regulator with XRE-family HTH domain
LKDDPRVLFGIRVRKLRKERGWSQEELAFECDLDRTYIGGIEQGRRNVGLVNICKIAKALKVNPNSLLDFKKI